ncbi:MAG: hypothetical protein ABI767_13620 [Rhodanobacter sp.]
MTNETSEVFFALIDSNGHRRVPRKISARGGRYGYAVHPVGRGNDASSANYTEDEKALVQAVVLHGSGVRAVAQGGPQDGQVNTLGLAGSQIKGYWLCPSKADWVAGAKLRPINEAAAH